MAQNNYYNAKSGEFAAHVIAEWKRLGCKPFVLQSSTLGMTANSLWQKLRYGVDWLVDNLTDFEDQAAWKEIKRTTIIRADPYGVQISKRELALAFVPIVDDKFVKLCGEFEVWIAKGPEFKIKWPPKPIKFRLSEDQQNYFRRRKEELALADMCFLTRITEDTVLFVRIPCTGIGDGTLPDQALVIQ